MTLLHGSAFFRAALPGSGGLLYGDGWDAITRCGVTVYPMCGETVKGAQQLKIKVQKPGVWAMGCVFGDCVSVI